MRITVKYIKMCSCALGPGRRCCLFPTSQNSYNVIGVAHAIVVCVGAIILLSRNQGLGLGGKGYDASLKASRIQMYVSAPTRGPPVNAEHSHATASGRYKP